jgi:hypothetical protein
MTMQKLIEAAVLHAQELSDPDKLAVGNHAYFQLVGLAAICKALPLLRRCSSDLEYIDRVFERVIAGQFNHEGIHREHSPDYHFFSLARLDAILKTGWFSLSEQSQRRVELARKNVTHMLHPDGTRVMFGDTERRSKKALRAADDPAMHSQIFYEAGYAMLKGRAHDATSGPPWSLAFWAGDERPGEQYPHGYGHSHSDNFTFEWFDRGNVVLTDSGKYSYDSSQWREYFSSTRAHNTVEIDGKDFRNFTPDGVDPGIVAADGVVPMPFIHAFVRHKRLDIDHRRVLVLKPGEWLVVADLLKGAETHKYTQWFHLHENWRVQDQNTFFAAQNEMETLLVQSLSPAGISTAAVKGAEYPRIQGWMSPAYMILVENVALGFTTTDDESNLVTLFRFGQVNSPVRVQRLELSATNLVVCWQVNSTIEGFQMQSGHSPSPCE